jgi:hypothetical protein
MTLKLPFALQVLNVTAQTTTNQTGGNSNEPLPPFQMQIDPRQVILLSVVSLAVESLAVASFATASFLAAVDFAGSSGLLSGFLLLRRSPSLGFALAAPLNDFFWIAIFVT